MFTCSSLPVPMCLYAGVKFYCIRAWQESVCPDYYSVSKSVSHSLCLETDSKQETPDPHEKKAGRFTQQLKSHFLADHLAEEKDGPLGEAGIKTLMNTKISISVSTGRNVHKGRVVNIFFSSFTACYFIS